MVDAKAYAVHNPSSALIYPYVFAKNTISTRDFSEGQLIFCAYWVNDFSFLSKVWGQLMIESMSDIVWNNEAFKKLVMKEERRTLVHGLVRAHRQDETARNFISTAANVTGHSSVDKEGIARLAKRELNGRQIKNAISCATSLARERGVPLTVEGIEHLLDVL